MSEPVGLGQVGLTVLRHWVLVTLGVVLGAGAALAITMVVPKTYTATSVQLVKGVPGTGVAANYEAAQYAVNRSKSYPAFIGSLQVLEGVRDDLGDTESVDQLRLDLTATNPTDTPLIRITATGRTAADAQAKANSAARHLSRFITQIEMVSGRSPVLVETAVQAGLPQEPSSPQTKLFLAVGAALGLALTIAIALIRDYMPLARSSSRRRRRAVTADEPAQDETDEAPPADGDVADDSASVEARKTGVATTVGERGDVITNEPDVAAEPRHGDGAISESGHPEIVSTDVVKRVSTASSPISAPSPARSEVAEKERNMTLEPWQWLADDILDDLPRASSQDDERATGTSTDGADVDDDDAPPRSWRSASSSSRRG